MNKFKKALTIAQKHFPELKIKYKDKSFFMKFLSFVMFFNSDFKTKFITTIGNTIYYPSEEHIKNNEEGAINILCHELMHIKQSNEDKLFSLKYLFPQIFAALSLLAFIHYAFLIFLVFLIPFSAYFRTKYEFEAYTVSLYCKYKQNSNFDYKKTIDNLVSNFTTSSYYWMCKNRSKLENGFMIEYNLMKNNMNDLHGIKNIINEVLESKNES